MSTTTVRLENDLKENFTKVCENMGLSISTAITIFAKTVVRERRIPFEIATSDDFNIVTMSVISDIEAGRNVKRFNTPDELFAELEED
jgi:DNA-damage-inducible protein J